MTGNIKLVAFDLDGTVVQMGDSEVSPAFCTAAAEVVQRGITLAVFSGRSITTMPRQAIEMPGVRFLCYANGAGIVDLQTHEYIYRSLMPRELALRVLHLLDKLGQPAQLFTDGGVVYPNSIVDELAKRFKCFSQYSFNSDGFEFGRTVTVDDVTAYLEANEINVDKLNINRIEGKAREEVYARLDGTEGLEIVSSGGTNLEFNYSLTSKGLALSFLAEYLQLAKEQVMAIGDNDNDVSMLHAAGVGVALGDGSQAAREAADYVTSTLAEDGAAAALRRFILD